MKRLRALCVLALGPWLLLPSEEARAQPAGGAEGRLYLYVSDFGVRWDRLEEWSGFHERVVGPVLASMAADGHLVDYAALRHHTGGPDNWQLVYFFRGWDEIEPFFPELFRRLDARSPDALATLQGMMDRHSDAIYTYAPSPEPVAPTQYVYLARYQVRPGGLEDWDRSYDRFGRAILLDLQKRGVLTGFGLASHDTGSEWNRVLVLLFDEWSKIDDARVEILSRWQQAMGAREWRRFRDATLVHDDQLYQLVDPGVGGGGN